MRVLKVAVIGLLLALSAPPVIAADEPEPETPDALPEGAGRDETFYFCTACHSTAIIRQQGLSRERWDDSLNWMVERHGMPVLEGEERKLILDYLTATFPPRQRGRPNPFLKP